MFAQREEVCNPWSTPLVRKVVQFSSWISSVSLFSLSPLLLHRCVALSWPFPIDTQQSQMSAGLQDNPSRLIITQSPQWRKPDPKHGTARNGQPTALLINERQLLFSSVCVLKGEWATYLHSVAVFAQLQEYKDVENESKSMLGRDLEVILHLCSITYCRFQRL